jgi:hypothetical protein
MRASILCDAGGIWRVAEVRGVCSIKFCVLVVFAHCPPSPTYGAKRDVGGDCPSEYSNRT